MITGHGTQSGFHFLTKFDFHLYPPKVYQPLLDNYDYGWLRTFIDDFHLTFLYCFILTKMFPFKFFWWKWNFNNMKCHNYITKWITYFVKVMPTMWCYFCNDKISRVSLNSLNHSKINWLHCVFHKIINMCFKVKLSSWFLTEVTVKPFGNLHFCYFRW